MNLKKYPAVHVINHPLIAHKMTIIRKAETKTTEFRRVTKEIAMLLGFEAFRNLKTSKVKIATPLEETIQPTIDGSKLCFVPILRAGLGMVEGFTDLIPGAKVGHIGLYRDPKTKKPVEYFIKLPRNIKHMEVFLIDPMFATGGSAIDAVNCLKNRGVKKISFICMVAAPEGVEAFCKIHKDVPVYIGALDRQLNKNKYILPGLGDAGDRIFGTED
ncbi:MAG: uracil phosphoribosyltransferase [Bacilli bacterium]|nr:uracil phosphoribosyltransferase [Bacilli bacterium]